MASDPISDPTSRARAKSQAKAGKAGNLPLDETGKPVLALVPDPAPVPALAPEPVPALSADLSAEALSPDTALALASLVREYDRLGTRIADLKASQAELKSEIEAICFEIPAKRISGSGWHTTRSKKPTTFIDKNKLAEKGVDPDTIKHATVTNWSREFVLPVVEKEKAGK